MDGTTHDAFEMRRCQAPTTTADCTNMATILGTIAKEARSWTDVAVTSALRYCYQVAAQYGSAWSAPSNTACATVPTVPTPGTLPPAPTQLRVLQGTGTAESWISLRWTYGLQEPMKQSGFLLESCTKVGAACEMRGLWSVAPVQLTQAVRKAPAGVVMCYTVRALGDAGRSEPSNKLCLP